MRLPLSQMRVVKDINIQVGTQAKKAAFVAQKPFQDLEADHDIDTNTFYAFAIHAYERLDTYPEIARFLSSEVSNSFNRSIHWVPRSGD